MLPVAAMGLLTGCLGCAVHHTKSAYLLSKFDSQYFLLSPEHATRREITRLFAFLVRASVTIRKRWRWTVRSKDDGFSFYVDPGNSTLLDSRDTERFGIPTERRNH